jgi:hypothetical protein
MIVFAFGYVVFAIFPDFQDLPVFLRYLKIFDIFEKFGKCRNYCNVYGQSGVFTVPSRANPTR